MPTRRTAFLGIPFDRMTMDEVVQRLEATGADAPYSYVVTPNVDHVVRVNQSHPRDDIASLYERSAMCVCDSRVLRIIARLRSVDLPVVPGSDLTVRLMHDVVRPGDRIAIVGGDDALIDRLRRDFRHVDFVHHMPPMGLREQAAPRQQAAEFIADSKARFTLIAVGSPQQEMIAAAATDIPGATGTALCIGASLDFMVGRQRRAPAVMQKLSLEWAYRLLTEPRRMWRRYLVEGPKILLYAARFRNDRPVR